MLHKPNYYLFCGIISYDGNFVMAAVGLWYLTLVMNSPYQNQRFFYNIHYTKHSTLLILTISYSETLGKLLYNTVEAEINPHKQCNPS